MSSFESVCDVYKELNDDDLLTKGEKVERLNTNESVLQWRWGVLPLLSLALETFSWNSSGFTLRRSGSQASEVLECLLHARLIFACENDVFQYVMLCELRLHPRASYVCIIWAPNVRVHDVKEPEGRHYSSHHSKVKKIIIPRTNCLIRAPTGDAIGRLLPLASWVVIHGKRDCTSRLPFIA